jgi:hypothetical protein
MDSPHHVISNGRWYTTWFLTVEKLCPLKDEAPKYGQEALDLRTRSYKSAPKLIKGEKVVATRSYRSTLKSNKGGTWKSINTHQEPLICSFKQVCVYGMELA